MTPSNSSEMDPGDQSWIDEDLIARTQSVWAGVYKRQVSRVEALEILGNVRWLARTLLDEAAGRLQS